MKWIKKLIGSDEKAKNPDDFLTQSKILDQVKQERTVYLNIFGKELDSLDYREIQYTTESLILLESKTIPEPFRHARVDALYDLDGQLERLEAAFANPPEFPVMTETWRDVEVELHPFVWNAVEFHVLGPWPDLVQLQNWFIKWFDPKNRNKQNKNKLHKVIHSMTPPVAIADGWMVTVDFGSASIDAFIALYKQCRFHEATHITINSEGYLNHLSHTMNAQLGWQ